MVNDSPASIEDRTEQSSELDAAQTLIDSDLLVEDVSIDGMCGVY